MDETEKIAAFFYKKKRKRRRKRSFTAKFASSIKNKIQEHNLGERMSIGFARIMSKKGF